MNDLTKIQQLLHKNNSCVEIFPIQHEVSQRHSLLNGFPLATCKHIADEHTPVEYLPWDIPFFHIASVLL